MTKLTLESTSRWERVLVVALVAALLLSAACRFIYHTDREYSYWISLYGESVVWLGERCAELRTPGVCGTAEDRRSFVLSLESYRDNVTAWWWPTLVLTVIAWIAVVASFFQVVRRFSGRCKRA